MCPCRGVHARPEVRGGGEGAPGRRPGCLQDGGQLQRAARLQAGWRRELHLLQVCQTHFYSACGSLSFCDKDPEPEKDIEKTDPQHHHNHLQIIKGFLKLIRRGCNSLNMWVFFSKLSLQRVFVIL